MRNPDIIFEDQCMLSLPVKVFYRLSAKSIDKIAYDIEDGKLDHSIIGFLSVDVTKYPHLYPKEYESRKEKDIYFPVWLMANKLTDCIPPNLDMKTGDPISDNHPKSLIHAKPFISKGIFKKPSIRSFSNLQKISTFDASVSFTKISKESEDSLYESRIDYFVQESNEFSHNFPKRYTLSIYNRIQYDTLYLASI